MLHTKKRKIITLCIILVIIIGLIVGLSIMMRYKNYQEKVDHTQFSQVDISALKDGTYIGEYDVDVIYAKVKVTIADGKISDLKILEHRNERGADAEKVVDEMIKEQRLDVDAVSSATNSSKVIRKAVENALTKQQ